MQNPFRNEATAFRFVLAVAAYFGLIALAGLVGGLWWGVAVAVVLFAAALWWLFRGPGAHPATPSAPARRSVPGERRILVIANETVGGAALRETIRQLAGVEKATVLVVAPVLSPPVRHWTSDDDPARADADARLDTSLARLREAGLDVRGRVGDTDPLQAIEDALRTFGADDIVVSTRPEGRSQWLERGVVEEARRRFAVPITHVVVDADSEREEVRE
jgi:hypothetical protein